MGLNVAFSEVLGPRYWVGAVLNLMWYSLTLGYAVPLDVLGSVYNLMMCFLMNCFCIVDKASIPFGFSL